MCLHGLAVAAKGSPKMINIYNLLMDASTRWYSMQDMLEMARQKRDVLDKMASLHINKRKMMFSITIKEWELLKMFTDSVLSFLNVKKLLLSLRLYPHHLH